MLLLFFTCGEKSEVHISNTIQFEGKIYRLNEEEPYSGALLNYENVTVTPHVGDDLFNNITEKKINHLFTNNIIKYFISHNN